MKYPVSKFQMTEESSLKMQRRGDFDQFLKGLIWIAVVPLLTTVSMGGELYESKSFLSFIRSVDPQNKLGTQGNDLSQNPCLHKSEGVKCNLQGTSILEIRLENLNLSGVIDAAVLCKLQNLEVLSLARNLIHETIPSSISYCTRLRYLNRSSNSLSGRVPWTLTKLKYLKSLDISNNHFTPIGPHIKQEFKHVYKYSKEPTALQNESHLNITAKDEHVAGPPRESSDKNSNKQLLTMMPLFLGIGFIFLFLYYMRKRVDKKKRKRRRC